MTQNFDPEDLQQELDDMQRRQTQIYARLEQIPNIEQLILALEKSENFRKIGEAIRPLVPNLPEPKEPSIEPTPKKKRSIWSIFNASEDLSFLDKLAMGCTTLIWGGLTYGAFTSWGFNWQVLVGMALFWVFYPVAIRIVAGGALD